MVKQNNFTINKYFDCFQVFYVQNRQTASKVPNMFRRKGIGRTMHKNNEYKNEKSHDQRSLWRTKTTLPKTCILSIFHIVRYQNAIVYVMHPKWRNEFSRSVFPDVDERARHQNDKSENALRVHYIWENKTTLQKNVSFQCW